MTHWARQNLVGAWCPAVSGSGGFLLRDLSGNGNHGTLTGMDPATDWVVGSNGYQALDFDGVNDNVASAALASSFVNVTQSTMFGWMYRSSTSHVVGGGFWTSFNIKFSVVWFSDANIYASASSGPSSFVSTGLSGTGWNSFAVVYDGNQSVAANRLLLFIGGERRSITVSGTTSTSIGAYNNFTLGQDQTSRFSTGQIADWRIYNRPLVDYEIRQMHQGGPGYGLRPERRRKYFFASGGPAFKPYWVRRQSQVIGGGVS